MLLIKAHAFVQHLIIKAVKEAEVRQKSETQVNIAYNVRQQMYDFTVRRSVFIRVRTRTNRTNSQFFGTDNALKLRLLSSVLPIVFSAIFCKPD